MVHEVRWSEEKMWPKIKLSFRKARSCRGSIEDKSGTSLKRQQTNLSIKLNVNEEYLQAFRSKSYADIWEKVHEYSLGRSTTNEEHEASPSLHHSHLHEDLLEPQQETLMSMIDSSKLHELLLDYFKGSHEAFKICSFLLDRINQTRKNYKVIQRALKLSQRMGPGDYSADEFHLILGELAGFASLDNPLAGRSRVQFGQVHELYRSMLGDLTSIHRKVMRRAKFAGFCKKAAEITLVVICGALSITTLAVVGYTVIGIATMPLLLSSTLALLGNRKNRPVDGLRERPLVRLGAQLDAAAKGTYILYRDFETMSRLVTRLHDEIEHCKAVIGICLRSQRGSLLREVLKEFESGEACFLEQLEELEAHVYLCFLTINRARSLLLQELTVRTS